MMCSRAGCSCAHQRTSRLLVAPDSEYQSPCYNSGEPGRPKPPAKTGRRQLVAAACTAQHMHGAGLNPHSPPPRRRAVPPSYRAQELIWNFQPSRAEQPRPQAVHRVPCAHARVGCGKGETRLGNEAGSQLPRHLLTSTHGSRKGKPLITWHSQLGRSSAGGNIITTTAAPSE